jgi:predicted NBD/HSP70 family sugar kinase
MYVLFDIGGTTTRIAFSRDGFSFIKEPILFDTKKTFKDELAKIVELVREHAGTKLTGIAAGVPGVLNSNLSKITYAPHLPLWAGENIKIALQDELNAHVFLENDATLAGLGEATHGAGKKFKIVAYLTVSTGVGGARIVHGTIDDKALAFEPGHQLIGKENTELEALISGTAIEKKYKKHPSHIFDETIWEEVETNVARGLYNGTLFWSPHVWVLGGGMVLKKPGIRVSEVEKKLNHLLKNFSKKPLVLTAELGDKAGLYGALAYARAHIKSK